MELPGIELAAEIALTCGNAELDDAKRRESTRNDLRIREGVDGINTLLSGIVARAREWRRSSSSWPYELNSLQMPVRGHEPDQQQDADELG